MQQIGQFERFPVYHLIDYHHGTQGIFKERVFLRTKFYSHFTLNGLLERFC